MLVISTVVTELSQLLFLLPFLASRVYLSDGKGKINKSKDDVREAFRAKREQDVLWRMRDCSVSTRGTNAR